MEEKKQDVSRSSAEVKYRAMTQYFL